MTTTPIIGATDWAAEVESPWVIVNKMARMIESMARHGIVEDRDLTAPPGSCADGACYLIAAGATGAWASHDGQMALAVGTNAASGWYFVVVATEAVTLGVRDENIDIRYSGSAWVTSGSTISTLNDLSDVEITSAADGDILYYDLSNGIWYNAPPPAAATEYYRVGFFFTTTPTTSEVLLLHTFHDAVSFLDDFTGQFSGDVGTNPTSSFAMDIQKNGVSVGTITVGTGGAITIATTGGSLAFAAGDQIKIVAPVSADATCANFSGTFKGTI